MLRAESEALTALPDRVAFLGFGLIGGSIARALRRAASPARIAAWTPDGRGPRMGADAGLVDDVADTPGDAIRGAGLVVLAGPPLAILATIAELGGAFRGMVAEGATITDVASTKARIVAAASAVRLPFVGGHPMAGRETSGVEASSEDLFDERPWVIVPSDSAGPGDIRRVEALAAAVGALPVTMTAEAHDDAVAAISHVPLVASAALVEAVALRDGGAEPGWPAARALAASGWAGMTRLARGDAEMGAGILATNGLPVAARLRELRDAIDEWIGLLDGASTGDSSAIRARLERARAALESGEA